MKLKSMLKAMGGDTRYVDEPELLVRTSRIIPVYPVKSGYIGSIDAKQLGLAACLLGAGRLRKEDSVDPAVGILMNKRYGDRISENEPYAYLYVNNEDRLDEALALIEAAVSISDEAPAEMPLVYDIIE